MMRGLGFVDGRLLLRLLWELLAEMEVRSNRDWSKSCIRKFVRVGFRRRKASEGFKSMLCDTVRP